MGPHLQITQGNPVRTLRQKQVQRAGQNHQEAVPIGRHQPTQREDPQIPENEAVKTEGNRKRTQHVRLLSGQQVLPGTIPIGGEAPPQRESGLQRFHRLKARGERIAFQCFQLNLPPIAPKHRYLQRTQYRGAGQKRLLQLDQTREENQ